MSKKVSTFFTNPIKMVVYSKFSAFFQNSSWVKKLVWFVFKLKNNLFFKLTFNIPIGEFLFCSAKKETTNN